MVYLSSINHGGCSGEWCTWRVDTYIGCQSLGDCATVIMVGSGWKHCTNWVFAVENLITDFLVFFFCVSLSKLWFIYILILNSKLGKQLFKQDKACTWLSALKRIDMCLPYHLSSTYRYLPYHLTSTDLCPTTWLLQIYVCPTTWPLQIDLCPTTWPLQIAISPTTWPLQIALYPTT